MWGGEGGEGVWGWGGGCGGRGGGLRTAACCGRVLNELHTMMARERASRKALSAHAFNSSLALRREGAVRLDCFLCKCTCGLSGVVCQCRPTHVACAAHWARMCKCGSRYKAVLWFVELDDIADCIARVRARQVALVEVSGWIVPEATAAAAPRVGVPATVVPPSERPTAGAEAKSPVLLA